MSGASSHRTIPNKVRFPPKADPPLAEECAIPLLPRIYAIVSHSISS